MGTIITAVIILALNSVISAGILVVAALITRTSGEFKDFLIASAVSSLVQFIPGIGWIASLAVFYGLLHYFTREPIWPNLLFLGLIAAVANTVIGMFLMSIFGI